MSFCVCFFRKDPIVSEGRYYSMLDKMFMNYLRLYFYVCVRLGQILKPLLFGPNERWFYIWGGRYFNGGPNQWSSCKVGENNLGESI